MQQQGREEMYFVWSMNWLKLLTTQWKVIQQQGREEMYFVWSMNWLKLLTTQWKVIQQQGREEMYFVWRMNQFKPLTTQWKVIQQQGREEMFVCLCWGLTSQSERKCTLCNKNDLGRRVPLFIDLSFLQTWKKTYF